MRRTLRWWILAMTLGAGGCARGPAVSVDGLPLRRVVIYRNGVGYFERAGHIEADKIHFKVRQGEVGDFLATLAVIERGGSSVRSASFPIDVGRGDEPPTPSPVPLEDGTTQPVVANGSADKPGADPMKTVVLDLDGKAHDLEIGYVAETPVWRPSYRLVIDDKGSDLQAWGIVQNLSGEDWKDVKLSLIAGAPLAFEATLGTPVIPPRPTVTDMGEVIASVPRSETSLNQEPMAPPPPPAAAAPAPVPMAEPMERDEAEEAPADKKDARKKRASVGAGGLARPKASAPARLEAMRSAAPTGGPGEGFMARDAAQYAPRNLSALAAVAVESGTTRYDLPTVVSVPDKSATMVMLLSKRVAGEAIYLFA
ncbi:MAG TPA: hypothetical protein VGL13_02645, partial [Polyangiaceae bacterium]